MAKQIPIDAYSLERQKELVQHLMALSQKDAWSSDPNKWEDLLKQLNKNVSTSYNWNNGIFYGDPPLDQQPWGGEPTSIPGTLTVPNTTIPLQSIQYQYDYTPDIKALADRISELELKVTQLLVILTYITGVKDGTKPEDIQSEEKISKTDA